MTPFVYPDVPHCRRHGPVGYAHYERYRSWLRDEFSFRCVYCLAREQWAKGRHGFVIDHLVSQAKDPGRVCDYENLVYACSTCNDMKNDAVGVPDPCVVAFGKSVEVRADGSIEAVDDRGRFLVEVLRLATEINTSFRRRWLRIIREAKSRRDLTGDGLYAELMGSPDDLPNLASKRPPEGNSRPDGIRESFYERRRRGELEDAY